MWKDLFPARRQRMIAIADLRPTQVTIGIREVRIKRERWRRRSCDEAARFLWTNSIPTILGPDGRHYMVDRHHLARALSEEGVINWPTVVVADYTALDHTAFWAALEAANLAHPFDDCGRRCDYNDLPRSPHDLVDDPYRSLAGALKRAGAYKKDKAPFSEFRWANFLRSRIDRQIVDRDFDFALTLAIRLALSCDAMVLPGWRGASNVELETTLNASRSPQYLSTTKFLPFSVV